MKNIDLTKLAQKTTFEVKECSDFFLSPNSLQNTSLKKECCFQFKTPNTRSRIIYRCVAHKGTELNLKLTLNSTEKNIQNVEVFLEIYVLNLDESNNIVVKPFLEIPQKEIKFEHKVTIGAPNKNWIKYLKSRGLKYNQALELISNSFITGQ
jgi:Fe-S cluster assembly scaffold protein SufB